MEPIRSLFERREPSPKPILPTELRVQYDGDLVFPPAFEDRPFVIGNFVSTLDGIVSFMLPGRAGGGEISGHNEGDRFIMGLLRASADAVMIGAGTLHATAREHSWTPERVYPDAAELYRAYRQAVLGKPAPRTVIVSASGVVDLERPMFHLPALHIHIVTTRKGRERLEAAGVGGLQTTHVTVLSESAGLIDPATMLRFLRRELGIHLLLHEGGPTLYGQFVAARVVDEFFLTLAPQLAGSTADQPRPAMIADTAFVPESAPWLRVLSVKQSGSHLYLRYERT